METDNLFKNQLLEKLTRTHFSVPIVILTSAAIVSLIYGILKTNVAVAVIGLLFIVGLFIFTLVEYMVHRFIFHMSPSNKLKEFIAYKFHGIHHDYPKDKSRLAMPPVFSTILAILLFIVFDFVLGDYAYGFMSGFLIGYTSYLFIHYAVHAYVPPKNVFKNLWINHGIHHYKNDEIAFGVSSPLWDFIFGTYPKRKK